MPCQCWEWFWHHNEKHVQIFSIVTMIINFLLLEQNYLSMYHCSARVAQFQVGCHLNFVTAWKYKAGLSVCEYQIFGFRAQSTLSLVCSSTTQRADASLWHSSAPRRGWSLQRLCLFFFSPPTLQMGATDNTGLCRESTDWWHHERLEVNCCYQGESCHPCSRCAAQILASLELLCAQCVAIACKGFWELCQTSEPQEESLLQELFFSCTVGHTNMTVLKAHTQSTSCNFIFSSSLLWWLLSFCLGEI